MNTAIINQLSQNHRGTGNQKSNSLTKNATTRKWLLILPLFLMTLGWSNLSWGQTLYENFNYTVGQNIGGNLTTTGGPVNNWFTHSNSKVGTIDVTSGSLSYTGLQASIGNKVRLPGNNTLVTRDVNTAITGTGATVAYYSFLINVIDNTQLSTTADYFIGFGSTSGIAASTYFARLHIRSVNSGANFRLGIMNSSGGTPTVTDYATDLNFGTTYLVVVKHDFDGSSNDISYLWVNPSSLGGVEPSGSVSNNSATTGQTVFGSIMLRNTATTPKADIDEIRVGTTWASVTPASSTNSTASDIIRNATFTEPTNIAYANYQSIDIINDANSIEVAKFDIRDGGATADADALGTSLSSISFTVANWANIRRLAIYDGTTEISEVAVSSGTVSFSGLTGLTATDGGSKTFTLRASFNSTVTDNQQFSFTVNSTTSDAAGSAFASTNAGGAVSSTTGDANRIEVTATKLTFIQQPVNTTINVAMATSPTVKAYDANNNTDLDYSTAVSFTSSGTLTGTPVAGSWVSNVNTAGTLTHTATGTGLTLTASSGSLTSATSSTFNITAAAVPSIALSNSSFAQVSTDVAPVASTTKVVLCKFRADVTVANATLNSVAFTTAGTYVGGGTTDIAKFELYYSSTNTMPGTALASTTTIPLTGNAVTFGSLTQAINSGNAGYFWITADIAASATATRTISALGTGLSLTFASGSPTGTISNPTAQTITEAPTVFISEYAGAGYNNSYSNEYIELTNSGSSPLSLTGWKLLYYNASAIEETISLTGSIPANSAYLIAMRSGTTTINGVTVGATASSSAMNSTGYVVLKDASLNIIDQAGASGNKFADDKNYEFTNCTSDNLPVANWSDLGTGNGTPGVVNCATTTPTITTSVASLSGFTYPLGFGPSISQSFNLSGLLLTGFTSNITITGTTNYEVSTDNTTFGSSITVEYTSATLASTPIYVRLKAGLSVNTYNSEVITISGGGDADGATVTCSGEVTPLDVTAPTVSTYSPADNATGVAISSNLVLTFNENVQKGTGNIYIKKVSDNSIVQTIDVSNAVVGISGAVVTINPPSDLVNSTDYYVMIDAGAIKDLANNNFAGISVTTTWNFTTAGLTYCTSNGNTSYQTSVTNVTLNTINNTTAKPAAYNDYTSTSTSLQQNESYNLSVSVNTAGSYTLHTFAWIDWNIDGDFADAGESFDLGEATNTASGTTSLSPLSITVPITATIGTTRMRVSTQYDSNPISCGTEFDGEVEDYSIVVIAAGPTFTLSSLPTFENVCINTTAGPESFTITGTNLTAANVTVAALNGFTYSTTSGGTYTSTLTLTPSGGNLSQQVFVKFSPTLVQSYDGNIVVSGGGATSKNCAASGSGVNYAPTITSPTSASVTTTTALLGGNITDLGCSNVTKRGIFWSTTSDFADGTGTEVSTTAGAPYSTGAFTVNVSGLSASTVYYFKAFTENSIGRVYTSQGTFSTACTAITSLPWNEGFESLASVGTNVFPPCWYKENGDWKSADASTNSYNDPRTGSKYITNTYSATNEYIWTPGFTLTAGISYDFSFWYVGDGNAGWTGEVFYNTNQQSTGATQLGSAFITSSTTSVDTYGEVVSTFTPSSTGTYYFAIRVNANFTPWYIGYDDFQLKSSVIEPEPTNHATAFTCGTTTASSIPLTWSDATGTTTPHGYLVKWSSIGYGSIIAPADGTPEANGAGVKNVSNALELADISGLLANTTYYFKIYSYTNSGTNINYKTDGTIPSTSCTTLDGPCLSESFAVNSLPTSWLQTSITFTSNYAEFGSNNGELTTLAISNPSALTFTLERTTNETDKTLYVEISTTTQTGTFTTVATYNHLNTSSGGITNCSVDLSAYTSYPTVFIKFRKASSTTSPWRLDNIETTCQSTPSIAISGSDPSNDNFIAGSLKNTIYRISATTSGGQSQNITQVSFRIDALVTSMNALVSNYKLYYSTNNLLDAGDALIESETTISATDFQNVVFTGFTQTIHAGTTGYFFITTDILTNAVIGEEIQVSTPDVVFTTTGSATSSENYATANTHEIMDSPSDVIAVIGSESNIVSSVINTAGPLTNAQGTKVWEFTVRDGGAAGDVDSKSTIVTGLTLTQNSGNSVNDWADAIESCDLFDANGNHLDQATLSATQIVFSGFSFTVPDNQQRTFSVRLTVQTNPNNNGTNNDGDDFVFNLSNTNITANASGSQFGTFTSISSANGKNVLDVTATVLEFVQQPSDVGVNAIMNPYVTIRGKDANGNIDNGPLVVSITSDGTLDVTPKTASITNGLATFGNIIHTASATGRKLTASAVGANPVISNVFNILDVTTFKPGELLVVGFDASVNSSSDDAIYLLTLVDVKPGTRFKWVNSRFEAGAAANDRTMHWGGSGDAAFEDPSYIELVWNGASNIAAGSIISFETSGTNNTTLNNPRINGSNASDLVSTGYIGNANVSASKGDQMWIVQGYFTSFGTVGVDRYSLLTGNVLFGLTSREPWVSIGGAVSSSTSTRESRLHPDIECFNLTLPGTNGYSYYKNGTGGNPGAPIHTGTRRDLIMSIQNASNWISGGGTDDINFSEEWIASTATPTASDKIGKRFTISASTNSDGTWVGGASGNTTDWFYCGNWEGLTVPDHETDVIVPNVTNAPVVDGNASNVDAQKYDFVAACNSLTINTSGSLTVDDNVDTLKIYGNLLNNGTLDANGTTGGQIFIAGNWTNNGSFDEGTSNVTFNGTSQFIETNSASESFYNINFINGATILNDPISANDINIANSGLLNSNAKGISLTGKWINYNQAAFTESTGTVTFNGSIQQTITTAGGEIFHNLTLNKSSESLVANCNINVNGEINLTDDVFDFRNYILTLNGAMNRTTGTLTTNGSSSLIIGGTGAIGGLYFTGGAANLYDFTLNRTSSGSATLTNNLTVGNLVTLTNGDLQLSNHHLLINGNLVSSNGYFAGTNLSELTINGSGTLTGNVQFSSGNQILRNLNINRNAGLINMGCNLQIDGTATMSNGELVTGLSNRIDLTTIGTLIETPINPTGFITGNVKATREIGTGSQTFGGIGLNITENSGVNSTVVTRVTGTKLQGNLNCCASNWSIKRYYDIVPTSNSGLNASMEFSYFEHELDGVSEVDLLFFKANLPFGGDNPWSEQTGIGNTASNTVSISSLSGFSRWTVAPKLNPLPVELISFSAKCNTNEVELMWSTASEINNYNFEVQKSDDGILWYYIGTVAGAGNSSSVINYKYSDKVIGDNYYYRLKQVDFDGNSEVYGPIVVNCQNSNEAQISVYPNPFNEVLTIRISGDEQQFSISILDATGKLVMDNQWVTTGTFDLSTAGFAPGIYALKVVGNRLNQTIKVVKR